MPVTSHRTPYLRLDDIALLKECRQERYRASGPGGQRRNKIAGRVCHWHYLLA